jgi:hypothetical protein
LKLVRPEADCFLPSPPRPIELMSPELPDWVLFFGTDNIPPPNETKKIYQSKLSTTTTLETTPNKPVFVQRFLGRDSDSDWSL